MKRFSKSESLKRKLRDYLDSENLEHLEYDLLEDIDFYKENIFF